MPFELLTYVVFETIREMIHSNVDKSESKYVSNALAIGCSFQATTLKETHAFVFCLFEKVSDNILHK